MKGRRRSWRSGLSQAARCSERCREKENIALVLPAINSSGLNAWGSPSHWLLPNCFHRRWTQTQGESVSSPGLTDPSSPPVVLLTGRSRPAGLQHFHWGETETSLQLLLLLPPLLLLLLPPGCCWLQAVHINYSEKMKMDKKKNPPRKSPWFRADVCAQWKTTAIISLHFFSHFNVIFWTLEVFLSWLDWTFWFKTTFFFGGCWYRPFIFNVNETGSFNWFYSWETKESSFHILMVKFSLVQQFILFDLTDS